MSEGDLRQSISKLLEVVVRREAITLKRQCKKKKKKEKKEKKTKEKKGSTVTFHDTSVFPH